MMNATFVVNGHEVEVNFSLWTERKTYKVNGAVVHTTRRFSSKSAQKFPVGDNMVEVRTTMSPGWSCQVFVDDTLFIEELFPLFKGAKSLHGEAMLNEAPYLFGIGTGVAFVASVFTPLYFHYVCTAIALGVLWAVLLPIHWRLMARGSLLSGVTLAFIVLFPQLVALEMRTPESHIDGAAVLQLLGLIFATGFGSLWLLRERVRRFLWMR